jgi:hypothetical protein
MALTKLQQALVARAIAVGTSEMAVPLDDAACCYLVSVVVHDLGLAGAFPELTSVPSSFFGAMPLQDLRVVGLDFWDLFERLAQLQKDADSYFFCLAILHKARLKYERILQAQPIPTVDQVGPRGLLQFGSMSPGALAAFLFWRKWIFDIDNRAGQETGYVFEPIIAGAIGGVAVGSQKSPVRRGGSGSGRQVDCLHEVDKRAYEIKLRVTIAASGQGRWQEELDFPADCRASGYAPILIVLDPTENPKLAQLRKAFLAEGGECHVGKDAWDHLAAVAGDTMATFLSRYVHVPIQALLKSTPEELPEITFSMARETLTVSVAGERLQVARKPQADLASAEDQVPDDLDGGNKGI